MAEFKKLRLKRFVAVQERETDEAKFWKQFRAPVLQRREGPVTSVHFSPSAPHDCVVTSSTRLHVFNSRTNEVKRTISRFKDIATSGNFRSDGSLIVAGGHHPVVQVFNASSRDVLRTFRGHRGPVHCTKFSPDNTHIISCGDDRTFRQWDITAEKPLSVIQGHSDYVRCAAVHPSAPDVWATGSLDHTVKLWDVREQSSSSPSFSSGGEGASDGAKPVMSLAHGAPVSSVLMLRGGATVVTAGGNYLNVWDVLSGGRLLQTLRHHQKAITSLSVDGTGERLLSAGIDGLIKVYDLDDFSVTHTMKYSAPILSFGVSPDNTRLVVGMEDGMLSIKQRLVKMEEEVSQRSRERVIRAGTYRYFLRGQGAVASADDVRVEAPRKPKLQSYEALLKRFEYARALDAALETRDPVVVTSLLEELVQRSGLRIALAARDEDSLEPIVLFVVKYVNHPRYSSLLVDVCHILCDLYAPVLGRSSAIDRHFRRVKARLDEEINVEKELLSLQGGLDALMNAASISSATTSSLTPSANGLKRNRKGEPLRRSDDDEEDEKEEEEDDSGESDGGSSDTKGDDSEDEENDDEEEEEEEEEEEGSSDSVELPVRGRKRPRSGVAKRAEDMPATKRAAVSRKSSKTAAKAQK